MKIFIIKTESHVYACLSHYKSLEEANKDLNPSGEEAVEMLDYTSKGAHWPIIESMGEALDGKGLAGNGMEELLTAVLEVGCRVERERLKKLLGLV